MKTASDRAPAARASLERGADAIQQRRELEAKLYAQGLTLKQVGEIVGRSQSIVMHDLELLGVERRKEWRRGRSATHPKPAPRPCAYCGEMFTPPHALAVGKFCSRLCGNRAKAEAHGHKCGEWRTCLECGAEFWRYRSQLESPQVRGDFCSRRCWGRWRWTHGDGSSVRPLLEANTARGHFGVDARRQWLGRFAGRKSPGPGGRPRGRPALQVSDDQRDEVARLARRGWGRRPIADKTGLSERIVHQIMGSLET